MFESCVLTGHVHSKERVVFGYYFYCSTCRYCFGTRSSCQLHTRKKSSERNKFGAHFGDQGLNLYNRFDVLTSRDQVTDEVVEDDGLSNPLHTVTKSLQKHDGVHSELFGHSCC